MSNNVYRPEISGPASLQEILYTMREEGDFDTVVLASADGILVATIPTHYDSDVTAALVAMLRKVSGDAQQQLGLGELDEVTIRCRDRTRLVCRYLAVGEQGVILVAIAPPGRSYRRATNRAIRQIRRLLA